MHVSLPMYDLPELIEAHESFWHGLRAHLAFAGFEYLPVTLPWPHDLYADWLRWDLLLSQTCGYPLKRQLAGRVRLVGVPIYNAPGCSGYLYSSALIVQARSPWHALPELEGKRAAHNGADSQSGYNALRHAVAPHAKAGRFFSDVIETTRHEESIDLVRRGEADIAAIDCVSLALLQRYQPERIAGVRTIEFTPAVAGLPFIASLALDAAQVTYLQEALKAAFLDPALAEARAALLLSGCAFPDISAYDDIDRQEREAEELGYPHLA
jgi:ABC-type phosphate/phosphonate transport system substrate-binding protein